MTSLARQLQRLAVPHTQSTLTQDKSRASLLFDPKEAATFDREAVFALGVTGLEHLENVNPAFSQYHASLFNKTSQTWERSQQSKEVNQQLDKTLAEFFIHLSPYILLNSAHKALEWLVYRYHIHQFNVDDLLLSLMPFHESKIFVRVLQMIKLDEATSKWNWLQPCAKEGIPLSKITMSNHFKKDLGFLGFVCDIVPKFIKVHGPDSPHLNVATSFFTTTALSALQHQDDINQKMLSILLPHCVRALKSSSLQYQAAGYMLLSQLVTQITLQKDALSAVVTALTKKIPSTLMREALLTLCIVFNTQHQIQLPRKCMKKLCSLPGLVHQLNSLNTQYNIARFIKAFLQQLLPAAIQQGEREVYSSAPDDEEADGPVQYLPLLKTVLSDVALPQPLVDSFARDVLEELMKKTEESADWRNTAAILLRLLERRFPKSMDSAIEAAVEEYKDDEERLPQLQTLVSMCVSGQQHTLMEDGTRLTVALHHAHASTRVLALRQLISQASKQAPEDKEFVQSALLDRLADDDRQVVSIVLSAPILVLVVSPEQLAPALLRVIHSHHADKAWQAEIKSAVRTLCSQAFSEVFEGSILPSLLPHLLQGSLIDVILQSDLAKKSALLKNLAKGWPVKKNASERISLALGGLIDAAWKQKGAPECLSLVMLIQASDLPLADFMAIALLAGALEKSKAADLSLIEKLLSLVSAHLPNQETALKSGSLTNASVLSAWIAHVQDTSVLPPDFLLWVLQLLARSVCQMNTESVGQWLSGSEPVVKMAVSLFSVLLERSCMTGSSSYQELLQSFMEDCDQGFLHKLLVFIWTSDASDGIKPIVHVGSFYLAKIYWDKKNGSNETVASVPVALFCSLLSSHESVRVAAISAIQCLRIIRCSLLTDYESLVKKIVKNQEELQNDPAYTATLFAGVLKKANAKDLQQLLSWISASDTPLSVKFRLMQLLKLVPHELVLAKLCAEAHVLLGAHEDEAISSYRMEMLQLMANRIDEDSMHGLLTLDATFFKLIECGIRGADFKNVDAKAQLQIIFLKQLSKDSFHALPKLTLKQAMVSGIIDAAINAVNSDVATEAHSALKRVKINAAEVKHELELKSSEAGTIKATKRARTRKDSDSIPYKRLIQILVVLQNRRRLNDPIDLAPLLFNLLGRLSTDEHEQMEYTRQLLLTSLYNLCTKWMSDGDALPKQDVVNVEVLVQCIRDCHSPQTQQQALMVMAAIAPIYPEYILHHVMSIFTFVGTSLVQQDDNYSLQLIWRTIDTLIPAIIQAHDDPNALRRQVTEVLRVFVDARHHIPRHRSRQLYKRLVEKVGTIDNLWVLCMQMAESAVRAKDVPAFEVPGVDVAESETVSNVDKDLDAVVSILNDFEVNEILKALINSLAFLNKFTGVHDPAIQKKVSSECEAIVQLKTLNAQQKRLVQFHATRMVSSVLQNEGFVSKVMAMQEGGAMVQPFQELIRETLSYLNVVAKANHTPGDSAIAKFWRALVNKIYEILDKMTSLLPSHLLLECISSLLVHPNATIRRKALDLLSTRLTQLSAHSSSTNDQVDSLLPLIDRLLQVVKQPLMEESDQQTEADHIRQMGLYNLKLLCKLLGAQHPGEFQQLFPLSISLLKVKGVPASIVSSALLCIGELCTATKARAIPQLAAFMPKLMKILQTEDFISEHDMVLVCGLTALHRVLVSLPNFISPYVSDLLLLTCHLKAAKLVVDDDAKKSMAHMRLKAVNHQLSVAVPARVLVPAISKTHQTLVESEQMGLSSLMSILLEHVKVMAKDEMTFHHNDLLDLFCRALDLRNSEVTISAKDLSGVESAAQDVVLAMVLRLSESAFRPMFYRLYDWACRDETEQHKHRQLMLFSLCNRLAENLKSLFNLFVGHVLKKAAELLKLNNTLHGEISFFGTDSKAAVLSQELLKNVVGCIYHSLLHDADNLVSKEIFTAFMQPLVDQLENELESEELEYKDWVSEHVVPCLSQLAASSREDSSWRALNYQICLKTRHSAPKVRYASLACIQSVAEKLGEEYMALLPETIPFLAELMEDDSEEVEQQCQRVVTALEELLGESLQSYF